MVKNMLSIIVPCYNEADNIPYILKEFNKVFSNKNMLKNAELILVNNNSKDNSAEVLRKELKNNKYYFARTIFQKMPGYGAAIWKGFESAKGEFICWTHADLQTDPKDTITALEIIKTKKNLKKCFIKGKRYGRPISDGFFTFGMSIFETLILGRLFCDINAQPNLFHNSFFKLMKNPPKDFSFDLYAYHLAKKEDYKIVRFPVFFGKRIHGHSAWNFGFASRIKFIKRTIKFTFELKKSLRKTQW